MTTEREERAADCQALIDAQEMRQENRADNFHSVENAVDGIVLEAAQVKSIDLRYSSLPESSNEDCRSRQSVSECRPTHRTSYSDTQINIFTKRSRALRQASDDSFIFPNSGLTQRAHSSNSRLDKQKQRFSQKYVPETFPESL